MFSRPRRVRTRREVRLPHTIIENPPTEQERLAVEFLARHREAGEFLRANVEHLARLATCGDESLEARAAGTIFGSLVEGLCDAFDPDSTALYIRLMAQLVQYCRKLDDRLDRELAGCGLATEEDLIARAERLRPESGTKASPLGPLALDSDRMLPPPNRMLNDPNRLSQDPNKIKLVVIPSRVTIGADIAITSVLIERLKQKFPAATLTLVGGIKLKELFGGDTRLSFAELEYGRRATLMGRLRCWLDLVDVVINATRDLKPDEFLVVDPDSRLTQLGMLPVARDSSYLLFPSREYMPSSAESLGRLASDWSGQVFGVDGNQLPAISLCADDTTLARSAVNALRPGQSRPVVTINFGVGDNAKKQVGEEFELAVLDYLLDTRAIVILDRGAGPGEKSRTNFLMARLPSKRPSESGSRAIAILSADEAILRAVSDGTPAEADLLIFNGRVGLLAGLIAASDLYLGYDSAGQHIAAAVGTPCIDVFSGYTSPRMLDRWHPTGPGKSIVIDAGCGRSIAEITEEVKAAASDVLKNH
jgi:hypothetical protein